MIFVKIATPSDSDKIKFLVKKQLHEHGIELTFEQIQKAVDGFVADEGWGYFLVAEQSGRIVGFACVTFTCTLEYGGKSAWLDELYVVPEKRNQGIGKALLLRSIEETRLRGCYAFDQEVDQDHEQAENLYRRAGLQAHNRVRWFLLLK